MHAKARWSCFLAALLVVGIVLSPLRAVAATIPVLIAYDAAAWPTSMVQIAAGSVQPERTGTREYVYDGVHDGYDDASNPPVAGGAGADRGYNRALEFADGRELADAGAICAAPAGTTAAEAVNTVPLGSS